MFLKRWLIYFSINRYIEQTCERNYVLNNSRAYKYRECISVARFNWVINLCRIIHNRDTLSRDIIYQHFFSKIKYSVDRHIFHSCVFIRTGTRYLDSDTRHRDKNSTFPNASPVWWKQTCLSADACASSAISTITCFFSLVSWMILR